MHKHYAFGLVISLAALGYTANATAPQSLIGSSQDSPKVLNLSEMGVARGSGSTCRLGCNEPNGSCQEVGHQEVFGSEIIWVTDYYRKTIWFPHMECAWALGADTCTAGPDISCWINYKYSDANCLYDYGVDNAAFTSTCGGGID